MYIRRNILRDTLLMNGENIYDTQGMTKQLMTSSLMMQGLYES